MQPMNCIFEHRAETLISIQTPSIHLSEVSDQPSGHLPLRRRATLQLHEQIAIIELTNLDLKRILHVFLPSHELAIARCFSSPEALPSDGLGTLETCEEQIENEGP